MQDAENRSCEFDLLPLPASDMQSLAPHFTRHACMDILSRRISWISCLGRIALYPRQPVPEERPTMTTFDKREEGFEKRFARDEELRFKANARRNKLLGLWAAEKLGISGAEADAYAKAVVMADFDEPGDG